MKFRKQTIEEEFREYWLKSQPTLGCDTIQYRETRQAFLAGSIVALCLISEAAENLPEQEAADYLRQLYVEGRDAMIVRATRLAAENRIGRPPQG